MIRHLILKNLVLIDESEILFGPGLTIISGETGAGKTALIQAISLALGARADSQVIRAQEERASVEAAFDIRAMPHVHALLEESGITHDPNDLLLIRREISREGRNRSFINCQMAPLPLIQKIGRLLIHLVDQHSHQELKGAESQREIVDLFAGLHKEVASFKEAWQKAQLAQERVAQLLQKEEEREARLSRASFALKELEEADVKEGEEENCFEEFRTLSTRQELLEKTHLLHQSLSEGPQAILRELARSKNSIKALVQIDPSFTESAKCFEEATLQLQEASHFLSRYLSQGEADPKRLSYLEERLSTLHKIKRKYTDPLAELAKLRSEVNELENLSEEIDGAKEAAKKSDEEANTKARALTRKREAIAKTLSKALTETLRSLNMPDAEVKIEIKPQSRSSSGDDLILFWMKANKGEGWAEVKECASGGELARLFLAIKTALHEKNDTPTIVFDEIDANVGGETAAIIGEKLHALGKMRQVICITHFFQVALKADHHIAVHKEERSGRTVTKIAPLDKEEREKELVRMLGGDKLAKTAIKEFSIHS